MEIKIVKIGILRLEVEMRKIGLHLGTSLLLALFVQGAASAAVPRLINYQGKLTSQEGVPIEGAKDITFRIYDAQSAGNLLWQEAHAGVIVQKGIFNILLGSVSNLSLAFDMPYYLEIKVGEETMSPRQAIASSGYAIRSETADNSAKFSGKSVGEFVLTGDITAVPTANKAVKLNVNAQLPVSVLKSYDSGWFPVGVNTTYTKSHNLGTTRVLSSIYFSENSNGSGRCILAAGVDSNQGTEGQCLLVSLSVNQVQIRTAQSGRIIADIKDANGNSWQPSSGYARIVMLALE